MIEQAAAEPTSIPDAILRTADIVSAFVSNNSMPAAELPFLIASVHAAVGGLGKEGAAALEPAPKLEPAVPIKKSFTRDFIICLEDGKKFVSLRRHLAMLGMTPADYRAKWGLPKDYPMVAPAYSEKRSTLAKAIGLGQAREPANDSKEAPPSAAQKRPGRPRKAA